MEFGVLSWEKVKKKIMLAEVSWELEGEYARL